MRDWEQSAVNCIKCTKHLHPSISVVWRSGNTIWWRANINNSGATTRFQFMRSTTLAMLVSHFRFYYWYQICPSKSEKYVNVKAGCQMIDRHKLTQKSYEIIFNILLFNSFSIFKRITIMKTNNKFIREYTVNFQKPLGAHQQVDNHANEFFVNFKNQQNRV